MFNRDADLFFEPPQQHNRPAPTDYGVLHLLRRDVCSCLGLDPATGRRAIPIPPALWPGGMAILAGVDLLAKFYAGDDAQGAVGRRFKAFVSKYFPVTADEAETIYQLRNALLHSFGLYSTKRRRDGTVIRVYKFILTGAGGVPFVQQPRADFYQLDLIVLHQKFEQAVNDYATELDAQAPLQTKFQIMFPYYGVIHME
jgi:hypothetical protein